MTSIRERRRRMPRRQKAALPLFDTTASLTDQQLDETWRAYVADRDSRPLRNRLVEHYLPFVRRLAAAKARRMRLHDPENAVSEVLAALVTFIVPGYDGRSGFERWARVCVRRKLIDQRRAERIVRAGEEVPCDATELDRLLGRQGRHHDLNFVRFTVELNDQQATVLWMRYYRGMTIDAIAKLLKISPRRVKSCTFEAVSALKNRWSRFPLEELPTYI